MILFLDNVNYCDASLSVSNPSIVALTEVPRLNGPTNRISLISIGCNNNQSPTSAPSHSLLLRQTPSAIHEHLLSVLSTNVDDLLSALAGSSSPVSRQNGILDRYHRLDLDLHESQSNTASKDKEEGPIFIGRYETNTERTEKEEARMEACLKRHYRWKIRNAL